MAKYFNTSVQTLKFNIGMDEYHVEPNGRFKATPTEYLDGLVALGILKDETEPEVETEVEITKNKK